MKTLVRLLSHNDEVVRYEYTEIPIVPMYGGKIIFDKNDTHYVFLVDRVVYCYHPDSVEIVVEGTYMSYPLEFSKWN
jgi:hypothetical protein